MKFIQLIRPINLVIIALTMYGVLYFLSGAEFLSFHWMDQLNFGLLVFSTLIIAAAGNIINDYFDVKADRINKPDRLIITKYIKPRWAIVTHWLFNGVAFGIALYLSIYYQTYSFAFVHLLSINLLWFYSFTFKRKGLVGNIIVAVLTAMIPLLTLLFFVKLNELHGIESPIHSVAIDFIFWLAFFAFIQNLAREIVKDIQDIEGDKRLNALTLPLTLGIRRSHFIVLLLLLVFPMILAIYVLNSITPISQSLYTSVPFYIVAALNQVIITLIIFTGIRTIKIQDQLLKLSMLIGLISLLFTHPI
jgi:4-hydroxybenzoate polyprenyltransferase